MKKPILLALILALPTIYFLKMNNHEDVQEQDAPVVESPKSTQIDLPKEVPLRRLNIKNNIIKKNTAKTKTIRRKQALGNVIQKKERQYIHDKQGNLYLENASATPDGLVFQGDVLIMPVDELNKHLKSGKELKLKVSPPRLWPKKKIPFTIKSGLKNKSSILKAIEKINSATVVKLVERTNEKNYIYFNEGKSNCYSYMGMIGGRQDIKLHPNCDSKAVIHEIMHALGFIHEHTRENRDEYIRIYWENIEEENHLNFKKFPDSFLDLSSYPFDFNSTMMYPPKTFTRYPDDFTITTVSGDIYDTGKQLLSEQDIQRIEDFYGDK